MISKNISKHPKALVEVNVTVSWADIQAKWDEVTAKYIQETEVPGFRKGQAPANLVEQQMGQKIQQEFLNAVMPQALIEALKGTDVIPIDYPKYQVVSFTKGADLVFRAQLTQKPEVSVGDYKAIKVSRPAVKQITEQDVDKVVDDLFKRWKVRQPASAQASPAPASAVPQNQSNGPSGSLSFGASQGVQQPAVSNVPDAPDDNFAKAIGAAGIADLRAKVRVDLESEAKYNNDLDFEEAILQAVEKITKVDVPDILVHDELNRMLVSLQRRVADMGLLLDDYLKGQGKSVDQLKNEWRSQAERNVRMELGLSEVARAEGVSITDADLQSEIDKIQDAKAKSQFEYQEPRMQLRHALRQTKTLVLLKGLAGA